jgi:hypothetical protein
LIVDRKLSQNRTDEDFWTIFAVLCSDSWILTLWGSCATGGEASCLFFARVSLSSAVFAPSANSLTMKPGQRVLPETPSSEPRHRRTELKRRKDIHFAGLDINRIYRSVWCIEDVFTLRS